MDGAMELPRKLALSALSVLVFVAVGEVCLRAAGFEHKAVRIPIVVWDAETDKELESGDGLHRVSGNLLWEPRPGAPIPWGAAQDEHVAEDTRRGPLRPDHAPPGVLRVVALGDSSTFGFGEPYANSYCAQLEALLNERGVPAEVIDLGVIGYTIRQGLERWRALGRAQHPDVVIAAFGAINDHLAAVDVADDQRIADSKARNDPLRRSTEWLRDHSRLTQLAARAIEGRQVAAAEKRKQWFDRWEAQRAREPRLGYDDYAGVRRVPLALFEATLEELRADVEASGARLVLLSMPRQPKLEQTSPVLLQYTELVQRYAREHGLDCIDVRGAFRDRSRIEQGFTALLHDTVHPTAAGHRLIAADLASVLAAHAQPPPR
jgi:lysophospholipase L1-like esterase